MRRSQAGKPDLRPHFRLRALGSGYAFSAGRRVVSGIGVVEGLGPQPLAPARRKFLGERLAGEDPPQRFRLRIDNLKVPKLMKEDIIQQESPDRQPGPLAAPNCSELVG